MAETVFGTGCSPPAVTTKLPATLRPLVMLIASVASMLRQAIHLALGAERVIAVLASAPGDLYRPAQMFEIVLVHVWVPLKTASSSPW